MSSDNFTRSPSSLKSSRYEFTSPWFSLRVDSIALSPSEVRDYVFVEHPGSVFVVPFDANGDIVLIHSYRHTTGSWGWELPAGTLADSSGAPIDQVASKELREETGGIADEMRFLFSSWFANGFARYQAHYFLARGVSLSEGLALEDLEVVDRVEAISIDRILSMLEDGQIQDGESALGLWVAIRGTKGPRHQ
jgi:ADP-ribose pyrophosphatase